MVSPLGAAAMVVATVLAAAPIALAPGVKAPAAPDIKFSSAAVRLAADSSMLNIPVNVLIDLANIPSNEVAGLNYEAAAFFFTGSWWVSNATNIWGTDPGDPPKYTGGAMLALPNPYFSKPVGQILAAMAEAELPVNSTCGTTICSPFSPVDPTGAALTFLGLKPFPLINDWFTVPLSALYTGYTFNPTDPGQQSYAGYVPTNPFGPGYDLPGTTTGPNGENLMPWAGTTVNLTDLTSQSWTDYVNHLMADPSTNAITIPTGQDVFRALTNLFASGVVAFDPFTPGMSYCTTCQWPKAITPEGIVGALSAADPGNTLLSAWLNNHAWQNSQGAPGTTPTPSTPESVASAQTVQPDSKAGTPQAPALDSQPPATNDTPLQGRHAMPDVTPLAAINAASKPSAPTTAAGDNGGTPPSGLGQNGTTLNGAVSKPLHAASDGVSSTVSTATSGLTGGGRHRPSSDSGDSGSPNAPTAAAGGVGGTPPSGLGQNGTTLNGAVSKPLPSASDGVSSTVSTATSGLTGGGRHRSSSDSGDNASKAAGTGEKPGH